MIRRLAIAVGLVGLLAVAAVVLAFLNLDRLIEANRERIVAGMSTGFGRPVEIDRISTGFHGGLAMRIDGLRVADDPAFGTEPFLTAERTYAVVHLRPLLRGRIAIRRIAVDAPHIAIVRTATGVNVDSLGRRPNAPAASPPAAPRSGAPADATAAIPAFAIALVNVTDGIVRYVDHTGPTPVETTLAPVGIRLSDLSLTDAMRMAVDVTIAGASPARLRVHGTIGPIGDPPFAADVPIEQHVAFESATVSFADLLVTGRVRRTERGTPVAGLQVAAPRIRSGDVELTDLAVTASENDGVATLDRLAFVVFGGRIEGAGRVDHSGANPLFAMETHVRGVDVSQALATRAPDMAAKFQGRLDADARISGTGGAEADVRRALAGTGHAAVRDGRLVGMNVADGVLSSVTGVAGVVSLVPSRIRERHPGIFATDDTQFDELVSDVRIANERIELQALSVTARDYAVRGKGVVTFAQHADVTATLIASPPLTADIIGVLKEAKYLTNDDGRLAIPFRMTGVLPKVRAKPDQEFVARVLRKAFIGEGLDQLLGGGRRDDGGRADGKARPEDLLKQGLDKFFRR
jgi:hypothetical protein